MLVLISLCWIEHFVGSRITTKNNYCWNNLLERERVESHNYVVEDWIVAILAVYALFCVSKESVVQRIAVSADDD